MVKKLTVLFLGSRRSYLPILLAATVQIMYGQISPVTFNVDRSVEVTNDVVYLQTTALLNLFELYSLPMDVPAGRGIEMTISPEYGSDPRVEIRVYDYNDEMKTKGSLIYAASGTKDGWNEDELKSFALFRDPTSYSQKLRDKFNTAKFKTTDIKKLSQFENLGSVCWDPEPGENNSTYLDGVFGNNFISAITLDDSGMSHATRQPDDEDDENDEDDDDFYECDFEDDEEAKEEIATASRIIAAEKTLTLNEALEAKQAASAKFVLALRYAERAREDADIARRKVTKAREGLAAARSGGSAAREAAGAAIERVIQMLDQLPTSNSATAAAMANLNTSMNALNQRSAAVAQRLNELTEREQAFDDASRALNKARETSRSYNGQALDNAANAQIIANDAYIYFQEVWDTLVQVGKTRDDYKLQYEKQMAKKPPVTTYYFGYILAAMDYNAVLHRVGIALENYNSFRIKANDLIAIVDKGTPQEMLQRIEELEEAYEQARNDLSEARENYADARTILDNAFAIVLGNLTLAQTAYAAVNSDMSAVTTARQRANVSVTFAQNILQDVSTLASQYQQAEDEVLQAEQAAIIAEEEAKGARLALALSVFAFLKAEAEVKEANRQADDDDDAAAGAAAAVTVANYASDSDLDPIFLIHALDAFGSPYLFSDEKDISYFHNSTIKPQGLINFQIDLFECATDSHSCWNQPADTNIAECAAVSGERWCEQLSPMPVVLIEVAIKNAKVLGFKVPGVSYISADRLQSPWSPYDTDEKARYVPLTEENEYIAEGDHQIIEAAYSTEVNTTGFPKYDHIKVPDLTGTGPQEFKMSNWARLPLVGTHKRLESLKQELIAKANATGVSPEEYFSFSHISHDFIKVHKTALGANSVPEVSDELTYELRNLMINRQYADRFSTMVTAEGPFEASYGLRPPGTQLQPNDEILTRAAQQEEISKSNERSADVGEPIRVYPNPTRGLVNIQFSVTNRSLVTVRLHSALGNLLHETEAYFDAGSHLKAIDVKKNCPPGTYIVTVTGAGKTQTAKVVAE